MEIVIAANHKYEIEYDMLEICRAYATTFRKLLLYPPFNFYLWALNIGVPFFFYQSLLCLENLIHGFGDLL